ncbi:MAG TPA: hypothetical protein VIH46_10725 [Candidatus Acidoferrales bacterium]
MRISRRSPVLILIAALAIAGLVAAAAPHVAAPSRAQPQAGPWADSQPLSDEELRARTQKLLANQHGDDDALELYDRIERHTDRTGGANPRTIDDKTYRVVPTGMGNTKILLHEQGKPLDASAYRSQLETLESVLKTMANPDDPRAKAADAKFQKRMHERAQFVDAASEAYTAKWVERATWNGRLCDVIALDPNPNFQPRSMFQDAFAHTTAKLWVDRQTIQIVHAEAHVTSDISFGGGILGKLYRGSVVSMDQAEMAPGIWLPTHYQYDFAGRKFLFSFDQHQIIEVSHYRRVGPPSQALQIVQNELSSGKTFSEDP